MPKPDAAAAALIKAALDLHARRLWLHVPADAPFLLRLPGHDLPLAASIMGHNGSDHGLFVARGERAFETLLRIFEAGAGPDADLAGTPILGVTVQPLGQIEPPLRGLVTAAGLQLRRESLAPMAMSFVAERGARSANRSEVKLLLACVRGVLAAHDAGAFQPPSLDRRRRRIFEITLEEPTPLIPDTRVRTRVVAWPRTPRAAPRRAPAPFTILAGSAAPLDQGTLPVTLAGWKEADRVVTERLVDEATAADLVSKRMLARYFGSFARAKEVLEQCDRLQPLAGFMEWVIADYFTGHGRPTLVEARLQDPATTVVERAVCRARVEARQSIYRVDATRPGDSFDVEDILSGERATVHDGALSGCKIRDLFLPLRLMRVDRWDFCAVTGPPLSIMDVDRVLQRLESLGADLSPGCLRRLPHLIGRLWEFALPGQQAPPTLCNTDGDLLEFHTATFRVGDAEALRAALDARKDLESDGAGDWQWLRPGGPVPGLGDNTILGRLQLLGDRLVLEVNSGKRLARARKWLERLPGVRFEQATLRALDAEQALDDRLPAPPEKPPSPELLAEIRRMHDKALRRWLDTPIPALGNRTPREACRTVEGRRHVALLVRTMPPAMIEGGTIPAPREMLMRELGIEGRD